MRPGVLSMSAMNERERLEFAIAAQSRLRGSVPDEIVDASIAALEERLAALAAASRPKQRKLITVLFADLSGSTAMGEALDPEELSDRFDALWGHLDAIIERFGGRIDKHIGDAVMGLWGADSAREDDAERAIRAALEMQTVLTSIRDEINIPDLAMRIGINTGPAVLGAIASTDEFTAMGDTVNVAARLEQAAPLGAVLVGHNSYRHVRGVFSVRGQEPLAVKGKRALLRTYVVDDVRPRAFRLPTRGIEGIETSMIGRRRELECLCESLSTVIATSTSRSVTIVGDAGIGKTRLLYEFEDWLRIRNDEVRLFKGRADHGRQGVPYSLIRDVLFARFEIAEDDPGEIALAKLTVGFRELAGSDIAIDAPLVGRLIGIAATDAPYVHGEVVDARQLADRATAAIGRLLALAAVEMPVVLLLEDLHWADRASLDVLRRIRRDIAASPLLMVALSRPPLPEETSLWGENETSHREIVLEPLSQAETEMLVEEVFQNVDSLPEETRRLIAVTGGGNPFFVEELVRMMIDEGAVLVVDDRWELRTDRLGELSIPPTVTGVIQSRLDRLPNAELSVLQRAAVIGSVFWDAAIPTVGSSLGTSPPDLASTLDALAARDLIERQSTSDFIGIVEYQFKHAILHEITYETVLRHDRQPLHRAVADWMASQGDASVSASAVARQYGFGGAELESSQWYARAAHEARLRFAADEAIDACRAALAPGVLDEASRLTLLDDLSESLTIAAQYDEALDTAREMAHVAEAAGDERRFALALMQQSHLNIRQGQSREALRNAEQAHDLISRGGAHSDELIDAKTEVAWVLLRLGQAQDAVDRGAEALELVDESTSLRCRRGVHSMLGSAHHTLGRYVEAATHITEALALDRKCGDRRGEAANLVNLGEVARLQGELAQSITMLTDAMAIVREIGDRDQEALVLSNLGGALVEAGDIAAGIGHLDDAVRAAAESGGTEHSSETHRFLAEAHLASGDLARAQREVQIAMELATEDENPDHLGHAWRVVGLVAAGDGRPVEVPGTDDVVHADECLARSATVFAAAGMERDRALALVNRADVAAATGDHAAARALREDARAILSGLGLTHVFDLLAENAKP